MSTKYNYQIIDELVSLKFMVNKKMQLCEELINSIKLIKGPLLSNDLDLISFIVKYKEKSMLTGSILSEEQNSLYMKIDEILYEKCNHEWVKDIIEESLEREREICYCKHCFYYKKK